MKPLDSLNPPPANPWVIAMTVMLATFMEVLDTSVANVSLPHIAGNLSAGVDESTWVLTSYLVSNAIMLPLSGWFSSLFGRKRFFMICVGLFTLTSFLCGLAPNLETLILFRVLQGAGGGALQPLSQAILVESFPRSKHGMAMAVFGMGVVVAPIVGPTLGGWITDNYSWRWIFLINIPFGLLSIFLTGLFVYDPPHLEVRGLRSARIDYIGLGLLSLGLGCLQIVLDKGQRDDWLESHMIAALTIIFSVSLVTLVIWELVHPAPVVNLRLLKDRNFAIGTFTMFTLGFMLYGSIVLLPIFLQTLMGYTAMLSGLVLSPGGLLTMAAMPVVGWLLARVAARWLIILGLVVGSISLFQMAAFNLNIDFATAVNSRLVQGVALAFLFVPINTVAFSFIAKQNVNQAAGLINLARNIGGSSGIAFVTTMLARRSQFHQSHLVGHLTPYDPAFQEAVRNVQYGLMTHGSNAWQAAQQTPALLYGQLQRQSAMLAFIDVFWILAVIFLAMIPLMFLLRKNHPRQDAPAAH